MPTPLRVTVVDEADGQATIDTFICQCGHTLVAAADPPLHVFAGVDTLVCDTCEREWAASWRGMEFCADADTDPDTATDGGVTPDMAPPRPVQSSYFDQPTDTDHDHD